MLLPKVLSEGKQLFQLTCLHTTREKLIKIFLEPVALMSVG